LIDIPPEVALKSSIKPGSVYYFHDSDLTSDQYHNFIVINVDPLSDEILLLVVASSQIDKVKWRTRSLPKQSVVEISPQKYPGFTCKSIVDCNEVFYKDIGLLIQKLSDGQLFFKTEMDASLVQRLRNGVVSSPLVDGRTKSMLTGVYERPGGF
jgi:hypothetical protein